MDGLRLTLLVTLLGIATRPRPLRDALLRTLQGVEIVGIRAVLVHAISVSAKHFYERAGFLEAPVNATTLMVTPLEVHRTLRA